MAGNFRLSYTGAMAEKPRVLSGIQTSGILHLGNYLGALKRFLALQDDHECYFFLADLHALTATQYPSVLRRDIEHAAAVHLACGLDPAKVVLFRQSAISAHAELGWLLNTVATMGELRRMTQFKDKTGSAAEESVGVGLFDYPVLQAADILLYRADLVPVGEDQKQHIELTRDLATRFNHRFGDTLHIPEPLIPEQGARIMALDDPSSKMSKSSTSPASYIALTDSPDDIRQKISRAVTDSGDTVVAAPDKPALLNLLNIFSLLTETSVADLEKQYGSGGYKGFKEALAEAIVESLTPIQSRIKELEADPAAVKKVLDDGAERARPVAEKTLAEAKQAMGL